MNILELQSLVKRYESHTAVNGVSFAIPQGQIFGLLGPNGAGKTSIIRMITSITRPDAGQLLFEGRPLQASDVQHIGYMPEERGLYRKMKVGEEIIYLARLKGLSKQQAQQHLDYWVAKFGIEDWLPKKIEDLSKGMQQKIQFITTVVHHPKLLILDEPFSGLDPVNATLIQDEIDELHRKGTTILFSTHRMEQVEKICNRIVLINKGQNVLEGAVQEIRSRYREHRFEVQVESQWQSVNVGEEIEVQGNKALIQLRPGEGANALLRAILDKGLVIQSFQERLPSLNDIFIKVVSGQ
jgi:ABC-2 type transport system ATP-binding protein